MRIAELRNGPGTMAAFQQQVNAAGVGGSGWLPAVDGRSE
jgi:hypothetical protein